MIEDLADFVNSQFKLSALVSVVISGHSLFEFVSFKLSSTLAGNQSEDRFLSDRLSFVG